MSLASYFIQRCLDNLEENVRLTLLQLSDPASMITVEASGALAEAAQGNMGPLGDYAADYLEDNATELLLLAADALGVQDDILNAINLVYDMIALALMANNELLMYFMKVVARNAISELEKKEEVVAELEEKMQALYNALRALDAGDPVWIEYLEQLRQGLTHLDTAKKNLLLVRNTLDSSDYYLERRFETAKEELDLAKELILPLADNPYLDPSWQGLLRNLDLPSSQESINNLVAIPMLSLEVLRAAQGYFETTLKANALILAFEVGVNQLSSLLPDVIKRYIIGLFDNTLDKVENLSNSMATKLNGEESARLGPISGFEPDPLNVSVNAFKWAFDLQLVIESMKLIPSTQLSDLNVSQGAADAYRKAVDSLKRLDDVQEGGAVLSATDAQEDIGQMEIQLLQFLLEAQTAIVSSSVRPEVFSLAESILRRLELVSRRDTEIISILQEFVDTPLQIEETLNRVGEGIFNLLEDLGMDNAADLLNNGDFSGFFNLNPANATYVGAALATIALLKECFPSPEDEAELTNIQRELERDQDLLNIRISFDFQLAIFNNLSECIEFRGIARLFNLKEIICGLLEDSGIGDSFRHLEDLLSF